MRYIIIYALGIVVIAMTAIPLCKHQAWWIRIFDFPRLQLLFTGLVVLVAQIALTGVSSAFDAAFTALLLIALSYQAYMMFPYTRLARVQTEWSLNPDPANTVSLLFGNVQMDNRDAQGLVKIIRENPADLVLLVETDQWWLDAVEAEFKEYPYSVLVPLSNTYGMLLFSRLELVETEVKYLVQNDIPSIHGKFRLSSRHPVEFRCVHPRPPVPSEFDSAEPRDAEMIMIGKENRENDLPFIVFGDLNDVAWSRTNYLFQNISGLLDPRIGRGFYHTFHARIPLLRFPLDHLFHSNHFRLVEFKRLGYFGSDHFPVYGKLCLEADAPVVQEILVPEAEEIIEAEEKVAYAFQAAESN